MSCPQRSPATVDSTLFDRRLALHYPPQGGTVSSEPIRLLSVFASSFRRHQFDQEVDTARLEAI